MDLVFSPVACHLLGMKLACGEIDAELTHIRVPTALLTKVHAAIPARLMLVTKWKADTWWCRWQQ